MIQNHRSNSPLPDRTYQPLPEWIYSSFHETELIPSTIISVKNPWLNRSQYILLLRSKAHIVLTQLLILIAIDWYIFKSLSKKLTHAVDGN